MAEATLAKPGLVSLRAGRARAGRVPVPAPTPPRPLRCSAAAHGPSGPVGLALGWEPVGWETEPIGKALPYCPLGWPLPTAFGQKRKETQTFVSPY